MPLLAPVDGNQAGLLYRWSRARRGGLDERAQALVLSPPGIKELLQGLGAIVGVERLAAARPA